MTSADKVVIPIGARRRERAAVVAAAIGKIRRFTMLPEVTLRIVEIVNDRTSGARDLHTVVSTDPVLCMRILKVVNSAFYGLREPITSMERAIVHLGGKAIKNIALAASLGRIVSGGDPRTIVFAKNLWVHSLAVAACSKHLAEATHGVDADEAFLCGLLHDIGFIVEMQSNQRVLLEALARAAGGDRPLLEIEDEVFGANHQDFGRGLCEQWQLPVRVGTAVGRHHDPAAADATAGVIAQLIRVADALAAQQDLTFAGHGAEPPDTTALEALGLTAAGVAATAAALPETTLSLQQVLS